MQASRRSTVSDAWPAVALSSPKAAVRSHREVDLVVTAGLTLALSCRCWSCCWPWPMIVNSRQRAPRLTVPTTAEQLAQHTWRDSRGFRFRPLLPKRRPRPSAPLQARPFGRPLRCCGCCYTAPERPRVRRQRSLARLAPRPSAGARERAVATSPNARRGPLRWRTTSWRARASYSADRARVCSCRARACSCVSAQRRSFSDRVKRMKRPLVRRVIIARRTRIFSSSQLGAPVRPLVAHYRGRAYLTL